MTPITPKKRAETETNGSRTDLLRRKASKTKGFIRKLAAELPNLPYILAKTQLEIKKVWQVVRKDEWAKIANELEDLLLRHWDFKTREAIKATVSELRGADNVSRDEVEKLIGTLRQKLGPEFAGDVAKPMQEIQLSAYTKGMQQIIEAKPSFHVVDRQAIQWLQENQVFWVRNYFDRQVKDTIAEVGQRALREGMTRNEAALAFDHAFADTINPQSFRYWQGFANHVTTRAREFGRVEGYVRAGITEIEIDAVLDHRTSVVCRHMNGRIIQVKDAVTLRDQMMSASNPEEITEIAPFMKPDDVLGVPTADLKSQSAGFALPPYHYDCRTRTVKHRTVYDENTVTDRKYGKNLGDKPKKLLSDLTDEEYSNNIQRIRTRSQLSYNRKDFKDDWAKHGKEFPDIKTQKEYRLAANRNIKEATRVQAMIHDGEKQYRFYGPDGITYVDGGLQIRCFTDPGDTDKAFTGMNRFSLWLQLKKNS